MSKKVEFELTNAEFGDVYLVDLTGKQLNKVLSGK